MTVEKTIDETIIKLPKSEFSDDEVKGFINMIEYTKITRKSKLTQKDIDKLADEANKRMYEKVGKKLLK